MVIFSTTLSHEPVLKGSRPFFPLMPTPFPMQKKHLKIIKLQILKSFARNQLLGKI
jgi:hypothetical protein